MRLRRFPSLEISVVLDMVEKKKRDVCTHCRQLAQSAEPVVDLFKKKFDLIEHVAVDLNPQEVRNLAFLSVISSRVPVDIEGQEL